MIIAFVAHVIWPHIPSADQSLLNNSHEMAATVLPIHHHHAANMVNVGKPHLTISQLSLAQWSK